MKRFLSFLLSFVLILVCIVPPVFAADDTGQWVDLFDYSMPNDGTSYYIKLTSSSPTCWFDLPYTSTPYYVDFVYVNPGAVPTSITCTVAGKTTTLTNVSLGDYVFRAYGKVGGNAGDRIEFKFNGLTGSAHVTFKSIHYTNVKNQAFSETATFLVSVAGVNTNYSTNASGDRVDFDINSGINNGTNPDTFRIFTYFSNWKKYDYIDFYFYAFGVSSISSIDVHLEEVSIPFDVNYLYPSDSFYSYSDGSEYFDKATDYYIHIRAYPSSYRNLDQTLSISIAGINNENTTSTFSFLSATGFIEESIPNPLTIFWNNLRDLFSVLFGKLDSLFTGNQSQIDAADNFKDSVDDQANELESMTDVMTSVDRPEISDINISASGMVNSNTLLFATSGISSILSNQIIIRVIIMSLTFALVGFILYGKK